MSIKTIDFTYNTTDATPLDGLKINAITDKEYASDEQQPLWGMEMPKPMLAYDIRQIWGLVSDEYENVPNISTLRQPYLYPPLNLGAVSFDELYKGTNYLPAGNALPDVLTAVYYTNPTDDSLIGNSVTRNGNRDAALLGRWQSLSGDANSAATLMKLLFTDLMSNYVMGTRGWYSESEIPPPFKNITGPIPEPQVSVYRYHRQVYYHWPYAIPALLTAALLLLLLPLAFGFALTGSVREIGRLSSLLSAGRLLTDMLPQSEANYPVPYKRWAATAGQRQITTQGWSWSVRPAFMGSSIPMVPMSPNPYPPGMHGYEKQAPSIVRDTTSAHSRYDDQRPFLSDQQMH